MSLNLLALLQEFAVRRGLPKPLIGVASQDDQILQLVGLLNEVLEDVTVRYTGTALQKTATWLSLATESQGTLDALAPYGFKHMINNTFWDQTARLPVFGPKSPQEWEALKAMPMTGPYLQYRIKQGEMLLNGSAAGTAGHTMVFEYASDQSVLDNDGTTYKMFFNEDTDTCVFPTQVLLAGLAWKWRLEKGLAYAEAFRTYEVNIAEFMGHDGTKPTLNMEGGGQGFQPGIFVPVGNWNV